jgi:hypothetical protein
VDQVRGGVTGIREDFERYDPRLRYSTYEGGRKWMKEEEGGGREREKDGCLEVNPEYGI